MAKKRDSIVDFFIVGAQKSATTSLYKILNNHKQLAGCKPKEPQFFSHQENWRDHIYEYESKFNRTNEQLSFEASVSYTAYPTHKRKIWEDLYEYNPNAKIIYIVRNPIDRIVSGHRFLYRRGYLDVADINKFISKSPYHLNLSKYYYQISPYIETFGKSNVLILFFDDLVNNQKETLDEVTDFLNIEPFAKDDIPSSRSNTKEDSPERLAGVSNFEKLVLKLSKKISVRLYKFIRPRIMIRDVAKEDLKLNNQSLRFLEKELLPDIQKFESLTGRDLSDWKLSFGSQN